MANAHKVATLIGIMQVVLSVGCCVAYGWAGDWKRCVYWGAAAVLTGSVTA